MNTTILNEVKNIGAGDYRKTDAQTQNEIENNYLDYMRVATRREPKAKSAAQKAQELFEARKAQVERYRRNGWTMPKQLAEFAATL